MKKETNSAPDLIRWVNYIAHTKPINTIAGVILSALGIGISAGGVYLTKYSLSNKMDDIEYLVEESENSSTPKDKKEEQNKKSKKS